jgi:hypothetical protein
VRDRGRGLRQDFAVQQLHDRLCVQVRSAMQCDDISSCFLLFCFAVAYINLTLDHYAMQCNTSGAREINSFPPARHVRVASVRQRGFRPRTGECVSIACFFFFFFLCLFVRLRVSVCAINVRVASVWRRGFRLRTDECVHCVLCMCLFSCVCLHFRACVCAMFV